MIRLEREAVHEPAHEHALVLAERAAERLAGAVPAVGQVVRALEDDVPGTGSGTGGSKDIAEVDAREEGSAEARSA